MNKLIYILLVLNLLSCIQKEKTKSKNEFSESKKFNTNVINDSSVKSEKTKKISPDYFSIPLNGFREFENDNTKWFISSDKKSKLYIVPYTDYSITTTILTADKITDKGILNLLEGERIQIDDKLKSIELDNIVSKYGLKIGSLKNEAEKIFGKPYRIESKGYEEKLIWDFVMLEDTIGRKVGMLKPFIMNELEFVVEIIFVNDKLEQLIYRYAVP